MRTRSFINLYHLFLCAFCLMMGSSYAHASWNITTEAKSAILIEASTGDILFEKNSDQPIPPASMSKLMTIYIAMEKLKEGSLKLEDDIIVSEQAWRNWRLRGSTMFLKSGDRVSVEQLLKGIIVQSGNDACVVLAEGLAGSEENFVTWMNEKAAELGLNESQFANSTGWPHDDQRMSARDIARLSQIMIERFPEYYAYFKEKEFTYNNIRQTNRNPILYTMRDADGLKTGHTEEAGYGLASSAIRDDRRLILVVSGLKSNRARGRESARLLEYGFRNFDVYPLFSKGETVGEATVWLGQKETIPLIVNEDVVLSLSKQARQKMTVKIVYDGPIAAPIRQGQPIAHIEITSKEMTPIHIPLVAAENAEKISGISRLKAAFNFFLWGASGDVQ
ncbi:MAG: D-alanyl-D-alanine carboxypeptidase [Kordiimonas sp.]|nr:D-alanyl-D-alanine carboxypeptidase [Kordiimonas sp.]